LELTVESVTVAAPDSRSNAPNAHTIDRIIDVFPPGQQSQVHRQWYILILGVAGSVVAFVYFKRSAWGRPRRDAFTLRIPMKIGDIVQKVAIAHWSRTLASSRR
jgi:hypothetical protein